MGIGPVVQLMPATPSLPQQITGHGHIHDMHLHTEAGIEARPLLSGNGLDKTMQKPRHRPDEGCPSDGALETCGRCQGMSAAVRMSTGDQAGCLCPHGESLHCGTARISCLHEVELDEGGACSAAQGAVLAHLCEAVEDDMPAAVLCHTDLLAVVQEVIHPLLVYLQQRRGKLHMLSQPL